MSAKPSAQRSSAALSDELPNVEDIVVSNIIKTESGQEAYSVFRMFQHHPVIPSAPRGQIFVSSKTPPVITLHNQTHSYSGMVYNSRLHDMGVYKVQIIDKDLPLHMVYRGEFVNGVPTGRCTISVSVNEKQICTCSGTMNHVSSMTNAVLFTDNGVFSGDLTALNIDKQHGNVLFSGNGKYYENDGVGEDSDCIRHGHFSDSQLCGSGRMVCGREQYKGVFDHNVLNGHCVNSGPSFVVEGNFANGVTNGYCTVTTGDTIHQGQFVNGHQNGYGTTTFTHDIYGTVHVKGQFLNGKINGTCLVNGAPHVATNGVLTSIGRDENRDESQDTNQDTNQVASHDSGAPNTEGNVSDSVDMYNVVCELVHPYAKLIKKQTEGSVGYDIYAVDDVTLTKGKVHMVPTGFKMKLPDGLEAQVRPRSSFGKRGVFVANSPGTIDTDYRGEVCVLLISMLKDFEIEAGDRIGQIVFKRVPCVNVTNGAVGKVTTRKGGFGSTGS